MNLLVTIPGGAVRDTFIPPEVAAELNALGNVSWNDTGRQFTSEELGERLQDADVCMTGWRTPRLDRSVVSGCRRLQLVAHTGGTVAPIVSDALYDQGVRVISGNRLYAESVAEGTIAYMLCALRRIPFYFDEMKSGRWRGERFEQDGLLDRSVGFIGFGMVAKRLALMLKPFRASIRVCSPDLDEATGRAYDVRPAGLEDIFRTSDIISLHVPLTPDTRHLIGRELLSLIRPGALLINTARGAVIDEAALVEELRKGTFRAVLDVFETEPLPPESPLRTLPNVLLLPHMAGPTMDRRHRVTLALIGDIRRLRDGLPLQHEISREYALSMTR